MIFQNRVRRLIPLLIIGTAWLLSVNQLSASFHLWSISQVYSNEDGSEQFIELSVCCSGENFIRNRDVVTHRDGGQNEQRFTFPEDLSGSTANGHLLLATGPIAGVEPDFVIPPGFVPIGFLTRGTVDISSWAFDGSPNIVTYDFIPNDGFRSIDGHGNIQDPATVTNFAGNTATLEPPITAPPSIPAITDLSYSGGTLFLSFSTENDRTYTIQYVDTLDSPDWEVLEVVEGSGTMESVSDSGADTPRRFYRIIAE